MRAISITTHGGPDVLEPTELPSPQAGPGQLTVSVAAAGVNFIDTYHRKGLYPVDLPLTPGLEGAGTVLAVGPDVEGFTVGDRVAWTSAIGSYAEEVIVPTASALLVPGDVDLDVAAAGLLQGLTAHYLALDTFPLKPGDTCLIHAGAGGVGLLLIQLAKKLGATVFTTVGTTEKATLATEAGADHVVLYREVDFAEAVREIAGTDRPLDVVYDGVGRTTFDAGLTLLRPRGLMVLFGQSSGPVPPIDLQALNQNGSLYVTRPTIFHYVAERAELERRASDIFGWIADGSLQVRIGERFDLTDAADAHRALEGRATTGKVLLVP